MLFRSIEIKNGIYFEKIEITRPFIKLVGESSNKTIISYYDFANDKMIDGSRRGTFRSYTVLVNTNNITIENLTIQNTASPRVEVGPSIALYAEGNNLYFKNIKIMSHQDTLFIGPLPPTPINPNDISSFVGPTEFSKRENGYQHYENCYICGDIDFIFGSGTAFFSHCHVEIVDTNEAYCTAPSTPEGQEFGFVFDRCLFSGKNTNENCGYLARPWRNYAKTIFSFCKYDSTINQNKFHDWGKVESHLTTSFIEYESNYIN